MLVYWEYGSPAGGTGRLPSLRGLFRFHAEFFS